MDSVSFPSFFTMHFALIFCCSWFQLLSFNSCNAEVTALYVFGDSLADAGNNNHLKLSLLKADFPHNGIDFPGRKATGRFSNGKNSADFFAERLGLPTATAYLAIPWNSNRTDTFIKGVSFASGGSGVLDSTNSKQCLSFNKQLGYFSKVYEALVIKLGATQTHHHLSKSMFSIVTGSNDIINYIRLSSSEKNANPHQQFLSSVLQSLQQQLQSLYDRGARKFAFVGAGPIGCCPAMRQRSKEASCDAETNYLSVQYNKGAVSMLQNMKAEFVHMSYSFFDTHNALLEFINNPTPYGFTEVKAACCGLGGGALNAKAGCLPISNYCGDRKNHIFWDLYHPTETTAGMLFNSSFNDWRYVYPINFRQLSDI